VEALPHKGIGKLDRRELVRRFGSAQPEPGGRDRG